jgi:hypothetical protein
MADIVTSFIGPLLGGGLGAGLVTFGLDYWKAERDFYRSKLEALYLAVHRYTLVMFMVSSEIQAGVPLTPDRHKAQEDYDVISLLVNLYFPRLLPDFEKFKATMQNSIAEGGTFKIGNPNFRDDLLRLHAEGEKLKTAIIDLAREQQIFLQH